MEKYAVFSGEAYHLLKIGTSARYCSGALPTGILHGMAEMAKI